MSKQQWGGCSSSEERWKGLCLEPGCGRAHFPRAGRALLPKSARWDPLPGFLPGRHAAPRQERGALLGPHQGTLGGPCHPPTPVFSASHVVINGLFQLKSKILPEERLPPLALIVPWTEAEIPFDWDLFSWII